MYRLKPLVTWLLRSLHFSEIGKKNETVLITWFYLIFRCLLTDYFVTGTRYCYNFFCCLFVHLTQKCSGINYTFDIFYWNIIGLQCCVSIVQWSESAIYIYIYTSLPPLILLLHHCRALNWISCSIQQLPASYLLYTWKSIYVSPNLPICATSPSSCVHMSIPYVCVPILALEMGSSVPFL